MGSISRFVSALALFCLTGAAALCAQSVTPPGIPSGSELQTIEQTLARPGITAAARREALTRLARLRQLSGDLAGAATSWLAAAAAEPGQTGDTLNTASDAALAAGAVCFAAMGEWEQAHAAIAPILASGRQGAATRQARYLDACIRAWQSDTAALISLANNPEYAAMRPAMYYVLWKTVAAAEGPAVAEGWKTRLFAEFPRSPESRIAASEIAAPGAPPPLISVRPSPLWLLLPGRDGFTLDTSAAGVQAAARAIAPPAPRSPAPETKTLQTGLFSGEANARAQMRRLTDAGFSPALGRRAVNGAEYWAVTVPAGGDVNRTIMELKNAGFESFPWE